MKKYIATKVPYSSIVGQSVTLREGEGPVEAQIIISVPNPQFEYKETAVPIADQLVEWFNRPASARWVKTSERLPKVGGSYITGNYVDDDETPRHFVHRHDQFLIYQDEGPRWYSTKPDLRGMKVAAPEYWLEGLPAHPEHKS